MSFLDSKEPDMIKNILNLEDTLEESTSVCV